MPFGRNRLVTAGALALALAISSSAAAHSQSEELDPSSVGAEGLLSVTDAIGSLPVGSTAEALGSVGSTDIPLGEGSSSPLYGTPSPVDPSITETKYLDQTESGGYEYWRVTSASMQRELYVEVVPAKGEGPAPILYMLDGVDSPEQSGWRTQGRIAERLADENVHVVTPTRAYAAYWTDWDKMDPVLGTNKWETFLTKELPALVEEQLVTTGKATNGKAGIGGISMGGQAAMHLAATRPDLYDGVMSFSGYYSTTDALGYQTSRFSVETRGGEVDNMWGPRGGRRWQENDTIAHPEGLADSAVYFSAGSGIPGPDDLEVYRSDPTQIPVGAFLERGVLEGTREFERVLDREGIEHLAEYADTGLHNWVTFLENFDAGWEYIKPALFEEGGRR